MCSIFSGALSIWKNPTIPTILILRRHRTENVGFEWQDRIPDEHQPDINSAFGTNGLDANCRKCQVPVVEDSSQEIPADSTGAKPSPHVGSPAKPDNETRQAGATGEHFKDAGPEQ